MHTRTITHAPHPSQPSAEEAMNPDTAPSTTHNRVDDLDIAYLSALNEEIDRRTEGTASRLGIVDLDASPETPTIYAVHRMQVADEQKLGDDSVLDTVSDGRPVGADRLAPGKEALDKEHQAQEHAVQEDEDESEWTCDECGHPNPGLSVVSTNHAESCSAYGDDSWLL